MIKKYKKSKWTSTLFTLLLIISIGVIGLTGCNLIGKDDANPDTEETTNSTDDTNSEDANEGTMTQTPETSDSDGTNDTESNENQLPTESEQDTTDPVDESQPLYYGEWVINLVQAYGVGTYSSEDAESLLGKSLRFNADSATHFGESASDIDKESKNPVYTETVSSESDFVTNYRIPFENLGIEGDTITEINVTDSDGFVATFVVKDESTLIIYGGGTYFELIRKGSNESDDNDSNTSQIQTLGYVKSIDTVNKTITLDQVELLYSTDEERLTELGMTSEDLVTGYYVYNEVEESEIISYDDTTSVELLDIDKVQLSTSSVDEFKARLNNNQVLCNLGIEDNMVVNISEQYLP